MLDFEKKRLKKLKFKKKTVIALKRFVALWLGTEQVENREIPEKSKIGKTNLKV